VKSVKSVVNSFGCGSPRREIRGSFSLVAAGRAGFLCGKNILGIG
jgi:hypothetical protein